MMQLQAGRMTERKRGQDSLFSASNNESCPFVFSRRDACRRQGVAAGGEHGGILLNAHPTRPLYFLGTSMANGEFSPATTDTEMPLAEGSLRRAGSRFDPSRTISSPTSLGAR